MIYLKSLSKLAANDKISLYAQPDSVFTFCSTMVGRISYSRDRWLRDPQKAKQDSKQLCFLGFVVRICVWMNYTIFAVIQYSIIKQHEIHSTWIDWLFTLKNRNGDHSWRTEISSRIIYSQKYPAFSNVGKFPEKIFQYISEKNKRNFTQIEWDFTPEDWKQRSHFKILKVPFPKNDYTNNDSFLKEWYGQRIITAHF